jgi:hypothetical protein
MPVQVPVGGNSHLAAVEANQFYVLTHGDFDDRIQHCGQGILAALDGQDRSYDHAKTTGDTVSGKSTAFTLHKSDSQK